MANVDVTAQFAIDTFTLTLKVGWNLVAAAPGTSFLPLGLWGWNGSGYTSTNNPVAWQGYWCKASDEQNVEIQTEPGPYTIDLADGWNLIGNCMSSPAALTLPSGVVAWIWNADPGSYQSVTTLQPGQGAWVRSTETGQQVTLTASGG
jgi:hypothetical protein